MATEDATRLWTNGYIIIGNKTRIPVQEISVDLSRDLKESYNSGNNSPAAIIPGQEKIDFKVKRIFSNTTMAKIYQKRFAPQNVLFRSRGNSQQDGHLTVTCLIQKRKAILLSMTKRSFSTIPI